MKTNLVPAVALVMSLFAGTAVLAQTTVVDCNAGQSLNHALSKLDKNTPITVSVNGTCTEYIQVVGFNGLTLKAVPGATLLQPAKPPSTRVLTSVLYIQASNSVTVDGFNIQADVTTVPVVAIGHGSTDVRLRNLTVQGGTSGIVIFENSQVSIAHVNVQSEGYTALGVYDTSDVHVELSKFTDSTGIQWHTGMDVEAAHVTIYGTTIRDFGVGMTIHATGTVDLVAFKTYYPIGERTDVIIENPSRNNVHGATVEGGSSLNLGTVLRITNPGQPWGAQTGGVMVSGNSALTANANLVISNSQGSGVFVTNNSHADLGGSSITGSQHGGLVVVNQSSIAVGTSTAPTTASGNVTDLFCDARSLITGGGNIAGATSVQCDNVLPGDNVPLP